MNARLYQDGTSSECCQRHPPAQYKLKHWMNTPLPPLWMGHSLTSTTYPTTMSSSMHVLGTMPPTHQPLPREEMYMLLLAPRISPLLRNRMKHILLKSKSNTTDRQTFRPRFRGEMLIHIWISPCYWKVTCMHKRSLECDLSYVFLDE